MLLCSSQPVRAQAPGDKTMSTDARLPFSTGPEVGQKIPAFSARDQHGNLQDFNAIRGSKGAVIVFFRSADW